MAPDNRPSARGPAAPTANHGASGAAAHLGDDELLALTTEGAGGPDDDRGAAHLSSCPACRDRAQALRTAETQLQAIAAEESWASEASHARARARLEERLTTANRGWAGLAPAPGWTLTAAAAVLLAVITVVGGSRLWPAGEVPPPSGAWRGAPAAAGAQAPARADGSYLHALPIRSLTPGATLAVAADELCRLGPLEPLPIPEPVRTSVLRAYGMEYLADHEYELDYLITPDLGGSPDPSNLWPEPYASPVWNAKVKDELEDLLPQLVCGGQVDLATAQREIAADWVAAYKKYFKTDRPIRRS